jgi:hypothetical protein
MDPRAHPSAIGPRRAERMLREIPAKASASLWLPGRRLSRRERVWRTEDRHSHRLRGNELPEVRQVPKTNQGVEVDDAEHEQDETDGDQDSRRGFCPTLGETSRPILWAQLLMHVHAR